MISGKYVENLPISAILTALEEPASSASARKSFASTLAPAAVSFSISPSGYSAAPVITGAAEYPEGLIEKLTAAGAKVDAKDFLALAEEAGSSKAVNIALMGRFSTYFPDITDEQWQDAIEKNVPAKFLELNRKAFELGRNA